MRLAISICIFKVKQSDEHTLFVRYLDNKMISLTQFHLKCCFYISNIKQYLVKTSTTKSHHNQYPDVRLECADTPERSGSPRCSSSFPLLSNVFIAIKFLKFWISLFKHFSFFFLDVYIYIQCQRISTWQFCDHQLTKPVDSRWETIYYGSI